MQAIVVADSAAELLDLLHQFGYCFVRLLEERPAPDGANDIRRSYLCEVESLQ